MKTAIPRIMRAVAQTPWAILPEKLDAILEVLELRAAGALPEDPFEGRAQAAATTTIMGSVALVPVYGIMAPRMNMMTAASGGISTQALRSHVRQLAAEPSLKAIVFDVDSPGGDVAGMPELVQTLADVRKTSGKRLVGVANTMMASAAYWMGSQMHELVASPSAEVGSIGVYAVHTDLSAQMAAEGVHMTLISAGKYKTEGHPSQPLDDTARTAIQTRVNEYYDMFIRAIASGRGTSQAAVREGYGEGRLVGATAALKAGMVDRVGTLEEVLGELTRGPARANTPHRAELEQRLAMAERFGG